MFVIAALVGVAREADATKTKPKTASHKVHGTEVPTATDHTRCRTEISWFPISGCSPIKIAGWRPQPGTGYPVVYPKSQQGMASLTHFATKK
jgi:hypothetical protein